MKNLKKALALVLTLAIAMSLGIGAFAAETYSITVHNEIKKTNVSISGQTFDAYRVFDVDYEPASSGTDNSKQPHTYTITAPFAGKRNIEGTGWDVEPLTFQDAEGNEILKKLNGQDDNSADMYAFAKAVNDYIAANSSNVSFDSVKVSGNKVVTEKKDSSDINKITDESIKIPVTNPGYYIVYASGKAQNAAGGANQIAASLGLDTTNANPVIEFKGQAPTIVKQAGTTAKVDNATTAEIGSKITFTLTSAVPKMYGFTTYNLKLVDTLSKGLSLVTKAASVAADDITVKIGGAALTYDTDFTVKAKTAPGTGVTTLTIDITDLKALDNDSTGHAAVAEGAEILVTYEAKVNSDAYQQHHELNQAHLEYSSDPYDSTKTTKTTSDDVKVYNFDLDVDKFTMAAQAEGGAKNVKLANAKFMLYKVNDHDKREYYKWNGNLIQWVQADDAAAAQVKKATVRTTELSGPDGAEVSKLNKPFYGLDANTEYFLEEIAAPNGYDKLDAAIKIKIVPTYNVTTHELENVKYEVNGVPTDGITAAGEVSAKRISHQVKVENNAGTELPSTGGIGTTIFYAVGAILMVTALVLLITKKKMSAK